MKRELHQPDLWRNLLLLSLPQFVCIFCVSAGIIFDLEHGTNENVHTLADTLYWAFLTLTGIGQPFEIETPAGKIATVLSVLVALIVVPGQLAKLAAASSGRMMMEAMNQEEESLANDFQINAGVRVKPVMTSAQARNAANNRPTAPASAVGAMGLAGRVGAEIAAQSMARQMARRSAVTSAAAGSARMVTDTGAVRRFRRAVVTLRPCDSCGEEEHDLARDWPPSWSLSLSRCCAGPAGTSVLLTATHRRRHHAGREVLQGMRGGAARRRAGAAATLGVSALSLPAVRRRSSIPRQYEIIPCSIPLRPAASALEPAAEK